MQDNSIRHAKLKLDKAKESALLLKNSKVFADSEVYWCDFLIASSTIFSKLEQGSKVYPKSKGWFDNIKHLRKNDPLLKYIHQARNCDEHTIENVIEIGEAEYQLTEEYRKRALGFGGIKFGNGEVNATLLTFQGLNANGEVVFETNEWEKKEFCRLLVVKDKRSGKSFSPPNEHLGNEIKNKDAAAIADLAIEYLEKIINEAENLFRK